MKTAKNMALDTAKEILNNESVNLKNARMKFKSKVDAKESLGEKIEQITTSYNGWLM